MLLQSPTYNSLLIAHCQPAAMQGTCSQAPASLRAFQSTIKMHAERGYSGCLGTTQELYGNAVAGRLISAFSRLFTHYLQARPQLPLPSHGL